MKQKFTPLAIVLLMGGVSAGYSQNISPHAINASGGWGTAGGYIFEYNIGEMAAVSTLSTLNVIVTQGLLQPVDEKNNAPLPVTLLRFTGEKKSTYNQLDWATTAETGQTIFELQRSSDGIGFNTIYTTPARNGANGGSYSYSDHDPFQSRVYYRLKMVESSSTIRYSLIVLLTNVAGSQWTVFPNPVKGSNSIYVTIQNSNGGTNATLTLTDASGRIVQSRLLSLRTGAQTYTLLAPAAAGTYFLSLTGITGIQNQKIIIY